MINSHHIEIVVDLQIRIFQKVVKNGLAVSILLKFDSNTQAWTVRLITNFCNAWNLVIDSNIINFFNKNCLINIVRNFSNNNLFLATFELFNFSTRTHDYSALTSFVSLTNLIFPLNNSTCREIWSRQEFHQLIQFSRWMVNHINNGIDDFCQIMWRNVCSITSRNPCRTIDQKVWKGCR